MRRTPPPLLLLAIVSAIACAGCAAAVGTLQPADTLAPGDFSVQAGAAVSVPPASLGDAVEAGRAVEDLYQADPDHVPTEGERQVLLAGALGAGFGGGGVSHDVMARVGVRDRVDAGLRWTALGVHADAKLALLRDAAGWDLAVSIGAGRSFFGGPVVRALDAAVIIDTFTRWDVAVPVIAGRRLGRWGRVWGGPKVIVAHVDVEAQVRNAAGTDAVSATLLYAGGFAGIAAGSGPLEVFVELTALHLSSSPTVRDREVDVSGLVLAPAAGLGARW